LGVGIPLHDIAHLNPTCVLPFGPDDHISKSLIEQVYALMHQAPLPEKLARVMTSMQGCQIVNRLHAFGRGKEEAEEFDSDSQKAEPPPSEFSENMEASGK
jgi:hypothetical protein